MCLGVIGSVTRTFDEGGVPMAEVATDSGMRVACLLYCPEVVTGAAVLMHMGFVMEVLDPDRATEATTLRRQLTTIRLVGDNAADG